MRQLYFQRLALGILAFCCSFGVSAQAYPSKTITLVVPFAPGGSSEIVARALAGEMGKTIGQSVFVDNKPGGAGNIAMEEVKRANPDGYTLILGHVGTLAVNPALFGKKLPYDPDKDFIPITLIADVPSALVGNVDFPPKTVAELITLLKANPNKYNFASPGGGSANRLETEIFMQSTGTKMVHVPYKGGGGQAAIGLISGDAQVMFNTLPSLKQFILSGKVKGYAVTSATRQADLPGIPTMLELGYPELVTGSWQSILVPANTPKPIVNKLYAAIIQALEMSDVKEKLAAGGANVMISKSPEAARQFMQLEMERWGKVVRDSGTSPD